MQKSDLIFLRTSEPDLMFLAIMPLMQESDLMLQFWKSMQKSALMFLSHEKTMGKNITINQLELTPSRCSSPPGPRDCGQS